MKFHPLFTPTEDKEKDFSYLENLFKGVVGKIPKYTRTIR